MFIFNIIQRILVSTTDQVDAIMGVYYREHVPILRSRRRSCSVFPATRFTVNKLYILPKYAYLNRIDKSILLKFVMDRILSNNNTNLHKRFSNNIVILMICMIPRCATAIAYYVLMCCSPTSEFRKQVTTTKYTPCIG